MKGSGTSTANDIAENNWYLQEAPPPTKRGCAFGALRRRIAASILNTQIVAGFRVDFAGDQLAIDDATQIAALPRRSTAAVAVINEHFLKKTDLVRPCRVMLPRSGSARRFPLRPAKTVEPQPMTMPLRGRFKYVPSCACHRRPARAAAGQQPPRRPCLQGQASIRRAGRLNRCSTINGHKPVKRSGFCAVTPLIFQLHGNTHSSGKRQIIGMTSERQILVSNHRTTR